MGFITFDIGSWEYGFAPMVIVLAGAYGGEEDRSCEERGMGAGFKSREEGDGQVRLMKERDGREERSGCMGTPIFAV